MMMKMGLSTGVGGVRAKHRDRGPVLGRCGRVGYSLVAILLVIVGLVAAPGDEAVAAGPAVKQELVFTVNLPSTVQDFSLPTRGQQSGAPYSWKIEVQEQGSSNWDDRGIVTGTAVDDAFPDSGAKIGTLRAGVSKIRIQPAKGGVVDPNPDFGWLRAFSTYTSSVGGAQYAHSEKIVAVGDIPYRGIASAAQGGDNTGKAMFAYAKNLTSIGRILTRDDADWAAVTKVGDGFLNFVFLGTSLGDLPATSFDTSGIFTVGDYFMSGALSQPENATYTTLPDGSFNTSNIYSSGKRISGFFSGTFSSVRQLTSLPAESFNIDNILEVGDDFLSNTFFGGWNITSFPAGSFRTGQIAGSVGRNFLARLFTYSALTEFPKAIDISKITSVGDNFMEGTFWGTKITSLPSGSMDTSRITKVGEQFFFRTFRSTPLESIPAGSFKTENIVTAKGTGFFDATFYETKLSSIPTGSLIFNGNLDLQGSPRSTNTFGSTFANTNLDYAAVKAIAGRLSTIPMDHAPQASNASVLWKTFYGVPAAGFIEEANFSQLGSEGQIGNDVNGDPTKLETFAGTNLCSTVKAYPQWGLGLCPSLRYNANGGSGTVPAPVKGYPTQQGVAVESYASGLSRAGYTFMGWAEYPAGPVVYPQGVGGTVVMPKSGLDLYAAWQGNPMTVTFLPGDGGTGSMSPQGGVIGTPLTLSANAFVRAGYTFTGWNTKADGSGVPYADRGQVTPTGNIDLHAQWKAKDDLGVPDVGHKGTYVKGESVAAMVGGSRTVTAHVVDAYGNPVKDASVVFSHPVLGTKTPVMTDVAGFAYASYSSTLAGSFDVVATVNGASVRWGDAGDDPGRARISFVTGAAPDAGKSFFEVSQTPAVADGAGIVELRLTLRDQYGNPLDGLSPTLSASPSAGVVWPGGFTPVAGEPGVYAVEITSTVSGPKVMSVKVGTVSIPVVDKDRDIASFVAGEVSLVESSFRVSDDAGKKADGVDTQVVSVTLRDANKNVVSGRSAGLGGSAAPSGLVFAGFVDKGNGLYQANVSTTVADVYTVEVLSGGGSVPVEAGTPRLDQTRFVGGAACIVAAGCTPPDGVGHGLVISGSPAVADGTYGPVARVTVVDKFGNLLSGVPVEFSVADSRVSAEGADPVLTVDGVATMRFKASEIVTANVSAKVNVAGSAFNVQGSPGPVSFVAGEGVAVYTVSTTANVVADGDQFQVVRVKALDAHGLALPVDGAKFAVVFDPEDTFLGATSFVPVAGQPGYFEAKVTSTVAGAFPVSVSYDGVLIGIESGGNQDAVFVAGGPAIENQDMKIVGEVGPAIAGSGQTRMVTATVVDAEGNPVPDASVVFQFAGAGLTPASGVSAVTGTDGVARVAFSSSTVGEFLVSGTVSKGSGKNVPIMFGDVDGVGETPAYAKIRFGADIPSVLPTGSTFVVSENPEVFANDSDKQTVRVNVRDEWGNPTVLPEGWELRATSGVGSTTGAVRPGVNPSEFIAEVTATKPGSYPVEVEVFLNGVSVGKLTASGNDKAAFRALTSKLPVIDEVTDEKVTGKDGEPGAEIEVTDPEGENLCQEQPVIVNADGTWTCTLKEDVGPDTEFEVVQKEKDKDPSEPVTGVTPPAVSGKPIIDTVTDLGATGTGVAGAEIEVTDPDSGDVLCTATVATNGVWSCEFTTPQEPGAKINAVQTEKGKRPSEPAQGQVPDRSKPPVIDEVTDEKVTGKDGEPGAEIVVTDPETGENLCKTTPVIVNADGTWTCEFKKPQEPGSEVEVGQKEDGKLPSDKETVTVPDRSKPPVIDEVTDEKVSGKDGEPGAEITVTDPETGESLCLEEKVIVGADGTWSCTLKDTVGPDTDFEVIAKEDGKLPSEPVVGVTPPAPGVSGKPIIDTVTDLGVSGKGVAGGAITVTDPETGDVLCTATVDTNGAWSCEFTQPQEPGTKINAVQTEEGKNPSEPAQGQVPDRSKPPVIDEVTDEKVTGKDGEPGAEVEVVDPETGENLCKDQPVIVQPDGTWTCEFKKPLEPGSEVEVGQKEDGKLPSDKETVTVPDRSKPPVIDEVSDEKVSGKDGVPGAEITVTDPVTGENLCKVAPVVVKPDGTWSCEFKKPQEPGSEVEVSQKEDGKLPSGKETVTIPPLLEKSEKPQVSGVSPDKASGSGVVGAEIRVVDPVTGENLCKTTPVIVGADGMWSCEFVAPRTPESKVVVTQVEDGKAPSEAVEGIVKVDAEPFRIVRYSGADRYGTSLDLNSRRLVSGGPVFVATGANFPDSLSAGPAVVGEGGSLVLSNKGLMKTEMVNHIVAAAPSAVYIIGGTGAISKDVEKQLTDKFPGKVNRVGGVDRYETSAMIADRFFGGKEVGMAFVASGENFPDALTAAAAGGALGAPVLLARGGQKASAILPRMTQFLNGRGVKELVIAGGNAAVGPNLQAALGDSGFSVTRRGGVDRYETNLLVNALLDEKVPGTPLLGVWLAAGANFPDALSAAVPAGSADQRLVLSKMGCVTPKVVDEWIFGAQSKVNFVGIVGGNTVLNPAFDDKAGLERNTCK